MPHAYTTAPIRLRGWGCPALLAAGLLALATSAIAADAPTADPAKVDFKWGVQIPMRDGVNLNATVYTPRRGAPAPCIFTMTPYISQSYHDRGMYFASNGYPFLTVDVRGRGNSGGEFKPFWHDAQDGHDVVEWLAKQPYCNGKVTMWGGSYAGYNQWVTAKEFPPSLATIVPVASPFAAVDFPTRNNVGYPYVMQWLTFTSGKAGQDAIFGDGALWRSRYREFYESGRPFDTLDAFVGNPSKVFQEWIAHPHLDAYWDAYNPTAQEYARLRLPILTITGSHDADQPGAMRHYREHMKHAPRAERARHLLVIGPWDHAGTRTPKAEFDGLTFGAASLVDLPKLHLDWFRWTMQGGPRPAFLKKNVAYYVMGAEQWRYADTLEGVTAESRPYYLDSDGDASDVFASGRLAATRADGGTDRYRYDPNDLSMAAIDDADVPALTDQRRILAGKGRQLVYHTAPFAQATEVSGFFKLSAWIGIDQPDTDFSASVYEIRADGSSIFLSDTVMRARYRQDPRTPELVKNAEPLQYDFEDFMFVSRQLAPGSRLRLVLAPVDSIFSQRNYNTGGEVARESREQARPVTVTLYHDAARPSALYVPLGQPADR